MKIITKPLKTVDRPHLMPVMAVLTMKPVPKPRAYRELVTSHGVHSDRAKQLLGMT